MQLLTGELLTGGVRCYLWGWQVLGFLEFLRAYFWLFPQY